MEKEVKEEIIKRIKILKMHPNVIGDFKQGVLNYSENLGGIFKGVLYWVKNDQNIEQAIKEFENNYKNHFVYHAILTHTSFGDLLSLLYVNSEEKQHWENEIEDLEKDMAFVYVVNLSDNVLSEFGTIGIEKINGGLSRKW